MAPPALIHIILGPIPAKNAPGPLSLKIMISSVHMPVFSLASIIRVFNTSSGVVIPAARAPAALPATPLSSAEIESFPVLCNRYIFIASHTGNWITVKGTSRNTVIDHPRYSSRQTPAIPIVDRWDKIEERADRELGYC